jgi:hypothetical protein
MSDTNLNVRWNDFATTESVQVFPVNQRLLPSMAVEVSEKRCPACDSIVYTRRHKLCGVCCRDLPEDCLFTRSEAEDVELLVKTERQCHRVWLKKVMAY